MLQLAPDFITTNHKCDFFYINQDIFLNIQQMIRLYYKNDEFEKKLVMHGWHRALRQFAETVRQP